MTLFDLGSPGLKGSKGAGENPDSISIMPLAARVRPRNFAEYVGQQHIIGDGQACCARP